MSQERLDGLTVGAMAMIVASLAERAKLEALTMAMMRAVPQLGGAILEALETTSKVNRDEGWEDDHKVMYDEMVDRYRKTVEICSEEMDKT